MTPVIGIPTKKETIKKTNENTTIAIKFILNIRLNLSMMWIDFWL
jgi:hypothetical protein